MGRLNKDELRLFRTHFESYGNKVDALRQVVTDTAAMLAGNFKGFTDIRHDLIPRIPEDTEQEAREIGGKFAVFLHRKATAFLNLQVFNPKDTVDSRNEGQGLLKELEAADTDLVHLMADSDKALRKTLKPKSTQKVLDFIVEQLVVAFKKEAGAVLIYDGKDAASADIVSKIHSFLLPSNFDEMVKAEMNDEKRPQATYAGEYGRKIARVDKLCNREAVSRRRKPYTPPPPLPFSRKATETPTGDLTGFSESADEAVAAKAKQEAILYELQGFAKAIGFNATCPEGSTKLRMYPKEQEACAGKEGLAEYLGQLIYAYAIVFLKKANFRDQGKEEKVNAAEEECSELTAKAFDRIKSGGFGADRTVNNIVNFAQKMAIDGINEAESLEQFTSLTLESMRPDNFTAKVKSATQKMQRLKPPER